MINITDIAKDLAQKLVDAKITTNIGFENVTFKPPAKAALYVICNVVAGTQLPSSTKSTIGTFAFNMDVYVKVGAGTVNLKSTMKEIGALFSPIDTSNTQFYSGSTQVSILSCYERTGGQTNGGWYYSTIVVELSFLT